MAIFGTVYLYDHYYQYLFIFITFLAVTYVKMHWAADQERGFVSNELNFAYFII